MPWPIIAAAVIGAAGSYFGQQSANSAAQAASREQMAFQERMANTRYQRTVADMRAAGLNPMFAYQQGGGSVPSGATYQPGNVGAAAAAGGAAAGSTAIAIRRSKAELEVLESAKQKNYDEAFRAAGQNSLLYEQTITAQAASTAASIDKQFYQSDFGRKMRQIKLVQENLGISLSAAAALLGYGAGRLGRTGFKRRTQGRNPPSKAPNWGRSQIGPPHSKY